MAAFRCGTVDTTVSMSLEAHTPGFTRALVAARVACGSSGPHLGRTWAAPGPHLGRNGV